MEIWAIGDLHLSFGVPDKGMGIFGAHWENHAEKIEEDWRKKVHDEDLVLIPGDISWALKLEEAIPDLKWIHALPGTKIMIRGNHDFWWGSFNKMKAVLPPSIHLIQNNAWERGGVAIGGARLWDTPEYSYRSWVAFQENPKQKEVLIQEDLSEKLFVRELGRLRMSLEQMNPQADLRIAMTHYPPIGIDLFSSRATAILEEFHVDICIFGHLHNLEKGRFMDVVVRGVRYILASSDVLDFSLVKIFP